MFIFRQLIEPAQRSHLFIIFFHRAYLILIVWWKSVFKFLIYVESLDALSYMLIDLIDKQFILMTLVISLFSLLDQFFLLLFQLSLNFIIIVFNAVSLLFKLNILLPYFLVLPKYRFFKFYLNWSSWREFDLACLILILIIMDMVNMLDKWMVLP